MGNGPAYVFAISNGNPRIGDDLRLPAIFDDGREDKRYAVGPSRRHAERSFQRLNSGDLALNLPLSDILCPI